MIIRQQWITRQDLRANPGVLYVFGDNEARVGMGGQAKEMRGEPNAVGVATLAAPDWLWHEDDVARQCAVIDFDLLPVVKALFYGKPVVWPLYGIGTGLARLSDASPSTFNHLLTRLIQLEKVQSDPKAFNKFLGYTILSTVRTLLADGSAAINEEWDHAEPIQRRSRRAFQPPGHSDGPEAGRGAGSQEAGGGASK